MSVFQQPVDMPLWANLLLLIVAGGFGYLRGWCDGKGIKL